MIEDLRTVLWKEWREYLPRAGERRRSMVGILIVVAIFGVFEPAQLGATWLSSWLVLVVALIVPGMVVMGVVADSFAGERERHTLETLLASRLPDRAILFGKLIAAVTYGAGIAMLALLVGAVTVNLEGTSGLHFYRGDILTGVVLLSLLMALLAASSGVLISLRSATVRQAQQLVSLILLIPALLPAFALRALSASQRDALLHAVSRATLLEVASLVAVVLLLVDGMLIAAAMYRFQRTRLVVESG